MEHIFLDNSYWGILPNGMAVSGRGYIPTQAIIPDEEEDFGPTQQSMRKDMRFSRMTTPDGEDRLHERHRLEFRYNIKPRHKK